MAETAITAVLSKFGELASREAAVLLQVGNDIMLLRDRLEWLQAFIRDADRKRRLGSDDFTRVWVRQTRDVAFQAEDALDDFFHKVDLESQGYRGWKIWGRYFTSCITQITVRHGLSGRIKIIKGRLDQMSENHKEYKIEHTPSGAWTSSFTEVAAWENLIWNKLVGFEGYLNTLKSQLLADKDFPHRAFFSILGESGIGKETLIWEIWNHVVKKNHFHIPPVWFNMPPNCSTEGLLEEVYKKVLKAQKEKAINTADSQQEGIDIAEKLYRLLHNKRYLVILGGISSKNILNCVSASLPDDKNGSRVVLILEPEDEEVARHADTLNSEGHATTTTINSTIQLSRLDKEKSGELFRWKVFGDKPSAGRSVGTNHILNVQNNKQKQIKGNKTEEIKNVETSYDQDVFDITGGHPLAIVVLSGLLRSKEKPVEWDAVLRQLKPGVEDEDSQGNRMTGVLLSKEKNVEWDALLQQLNPAREAKLSNRMSIERIFSTSFDDLPHDLKSCFLYFAAYPKNISHPADQIVRMWMAEGFIKPQKGKTIEKLGRDYLKELVSRCLVEIEQTNDNGDIVLVRVHNRLLGFLQSEAQEASFIEIHDKNDVLAPAAVRRLSIQNDSGSYTTSNNTFPKLRSFICRVSGETHRCGGASTDKKNSSGHKLLCMMPGWIREAGHSSSTNAKHKHNITSKHDLNFLCGSKFLRVISILGLGLNELPKEIGDMIHLRYLSVASHDLKKLPYSIERLLNLQTLDIRNTQVKEINPKFWKIKSLRHVLAEELMLPKLVINEPDELQTLHGVKPAPETWDEGSCPLDKLIKLRSLELHGFVDVHHKALASALKNMHLLDHLKLKGTEIPSCVFTAPGLRSLQTLVLDGNVSWQELPSDVRKLRPNLITVQVRDLNEMPPEYLAGLRDFCRVHSI